MSGLDKPSRAEDEYFARQELERRRRWAVEQAETMADAEKKQAKELHWMKCPKCGMDMSEIEMQGVKVDQCAFCGGIYLDAGEIEQIMKSHDQGIAARIFSVFR
jgi:acetyl-CoA carboxylase beta subunit